MAIYYVDATGGNDDNTGLSAALAWKTIAKVNASTFNPGDSILFKRGEMWRETLVVPSSGTAAAPITFGCYGSSGPAPVLNGTAVIASASFSKFDGSGAAKEKLTNGNFDAWGSASDLTNWTKILGGASTIQQESADVHTPGGSAVKLSIDADNSAAAIGSTLALPRSKSCTLSIWYKTAAGKTAYLKIWNGPANIGLKSDGTWGDAASLISLPAATAWTNFTLNFTSHDAQKFFSVRVSRLSAASSVLLFDDFSILAPEAYDNIYRAAYANPLSLDPWDVMVWEAGKRMAAATTTTTLDRIEASPGSFLFVAAEGYLYTHGYASDDPLVNGKIYEVPLLAHNVDDGGRDYTVFERLDCIRTCGPTTGTLGGIKVTGKHGRFRGCRSHDHRRHALTYYHGAIDAVAEDCDLYDCWSTTAVAVYGTAADNQILRSRIHDAYQAAIVIHGGAQRTTLDRCSIYHGAAWAASRAVYTYDAGTADVTISRCRIYGYGSRVLDAAATARVRFQSCALDLSRWTDDVFYCDASSNNAFLNNSLFGYVGYALRLKNVATGTTLKNNVFHGAKFCSVDTGSKVSFDSDYNCFYGAAVAQPWHWDGVDYATLGDWRTSSGADAHSLDTDPKYVGAAGRNLQLRATSPCRQAGVDVGLIEDIDGNPIPKRAGNPPDMGAHERLGVSIYVRGIVQDIKIHNCSQTITIEQEG